MKKIIFILSALVLMCAGCKDSEATKAQKQLEAVIGQVKVPVQVDSTTTLESITLANGMLTSRISMPHERLAKIKPDSLRKAQIEQLSTNLTSRKLSKIAKEANVAMRYVYVGGGDSVVIVITPDEMK